MLQEILVVLILLVVVFFIGRSLYFKIRPSKGKGGMPTGGCSGCSGCCH